MTQRDPYILDRPTARRLRARDALLCVGVAVVLLLLIEGPSIRHTGREMSPGIERTVVRAVGEPAGWVGDRLPLSDAADSMTGWLSPDDKLTGPGGFAEVSTSAPIAGGGGAPGSITPDYFDPAALGQKPKKLPALRTLLVTGDSMAQPLDAELARRLADSGGVRTERDAHLGTAISAIELLDWGKLSVRQASKRPEAVVMFIGANDAFPMKAVDGSNVNCCTPQWAALYATRVRRMMDTYRSRGAARVYWLTLPLPRSDIRRQVAKTVNAAIVVAAQPFRSQVRVLDMAGLFTPGGRFRAAMTIGGRETIVRNPDGVHLNAAGASLAANAVQARLRADFTKLGG